VLEQKRKKAAESRLGSVQEWKASRENLVGRAADPAEQFGKMGCGKQGARASTLAAFTLLSIVDHLKGSVVIA
jgi:hypothetical protein